MTHQSRRNPEDETVAVVVHLKLQTLLIVDRFRQDNGLSGRGEVIGRLLEEVLSPSDTEWGSSQDQLD